MKLTHQDVEVFPWFKAICLFEILSDLFPRWPQEALPWVKWLSSKEQRDVWEHPAQQGIQDMRQALKQNHTEHSVLGWSRVFLLLSQEPVLTTGTVQCFRVLPFLFPALAPSFFMSWCATKPLCCELVQIRPCFLSYLLCIYLRWRDRAESCRLLMW